MNEYRIECVQTVADSGERRRRTMRVYALLLEIARRKETADGGEAGNPEPSAADDARLEAGATPC